MSILSTKYLSKNTFVLEAREIDEKIREVNYFLLF